MAASPPPGTDDAHEGAHDNAPAPTSMDPPSPSVSMFVASVDIGTDTVVAAFGERAAPSFQCTLVPNEVSSLATPSAVHFGSANHCEASTPQARNIGDAAKSAMRVTPLSGISGLPLLLANKEAYDRAPDAGVEVDGEGAVYINGEHFCAQQCLGAMLASMRRHAERASASAAPGAQTEISRWVLAAPPAVGTNAKAKLLDAAAVAGLGENVDVVDSIDAAASVYAPTHRAPAGSPPKKVLIVDVGYAFTSAGVYELPSEGAPVRKSLAHAVVGARDLDRELHKLLSDDLQKKHACKVELRTKAARRLMDEVVKAKKILSTIAQATVELECFGEDSKDYRLPITRSAFEEAVADQVKVIAAVVAEAIESSGVPAEELDAVEGIGGATRVPCVIDAVARAASVSPPLGRMLDSASCVAQGAVFMAQADPADRPFAPAKEAPVLRTSCSDEQREALRSHTARLADDVLARLTAREDELQKVDEDAAARGEAFNALEAYVLEMKGVLSGGRAHGNKLEAARSLLDSAEDWCYSDDSEAANTEQLTAKLAELRSGVEEACPDYFDAVREDRERLEATLKAESEAEAARVKLEGKDDHDQRRLKYPERMKKVMLNKDEGVGLFKDGNMEVAISRWDKALDHCEKFVDVSPEQQAEISSVKLSLFLNKSQANLKLATEISLKRAEEAATSALEIDGMNSKALYRRAAAREKSGKYAEAKADLKAHPDQEDTAVIALTKRVDAQIARQAKKEKQVYGNMFG
ncbi:hypothetical protein PPROV_000384700 [Pycnococcus provasolii]|uniref:Uncharacterized protein n=2 Tax=Pycnococcus provasolii TaxID=41880 RepID=A0A830HDI5_9CHLO|nr:hypothetical protein PPROV_000384700 [Pycnococcus provasolii]